MDTAETQVISGEGGPTQVAPQIDNDQETQVIQDQDTQELQQQETQVIQGLGNQQQQSQVVQDQEQPGASTSIIIRTDIVAAEAECLELGGAGSIIRRPFDPYAYDLDKNFRLTKFADLRGRTATIPQETLTKLLDGLIDSTTSFTSAGGGDGSGDNNNITCYQSDDGIVFNNLSSSESNMAKAGGIGMEASVTALRQQGLSLVHTTDYLYPVIDDPYMQGKIACAQVLSDLYAKGVTECDNLLMLMGVSMKLSDKERDAIIPLVMRGFKDAALEAGTHVTGGQTVLNPWLTIGGVASSVCQAMEIIKPENSIAGDVLVLTKPLGTAVATSAHQWLDMPERWNRIKLVITEEEVRKAYNRAIDSMARLNRNAARLMHKYYAHAATDVTSYGLLGHAQNLAKNQKAEVSFVIHNLPVISKMTAVAKACGNMFQLIQGLTPETSGGLLVCLPREQAAAFCKEIEKQEGYQAWIIGIVEKGNRSARIIDKPRVIEVPSKEKDGQLW